MHIRCPHCRNPIDLVDDSNLKDIECPSCGSNFSIVGDESTATYLPETKAVGHYKLLEQVGVGAFGSVWRAQDTQLDRPVAIKIPRKEQLNPAEAEQFLREARAAAQLNHPNIVAVHEVGREDGQIYIVSDFVHGATLSDWIEDQSLTPREAAELCATIAESLQHAHNCGVIHRDLKPSNIMMDLEGNPHIMDFGLAKREAGEITMTVDGKVLGTPAYMPPEQARGHGHDADARSDQYSLGVILFQLLTGELPFRGNPRMLIVQILRDDPPILRRLNGAVPRDLETICLKCLTKEPQKRYGSTKEVADELRRFLRGEPIDARPITRAYRTWRWCKRNRVVASLGASVATLLLTLGIAGPILAIKQTWLATQNQRLVEKESDARKVAVKKSTELQERSQELEYQLRIATAMRLAAQSQSIQDDFPVRSLLLATEAADVTRRHNGYVLPIVHQSLRDGLDRVGGRPIVAHQSQVSVVAISPDGRWVVTFTPSFSHRLSDLNARHPSGSDVAIEVDSTVESFTISDDSRWLVAGGHGKAWLWDLTSADVAKSVVVLEGHLSRIETGGVVEVHHVSVESIAISPDSHWLVTASNTRDRKARPRLWDMTSDDIAASSIALKGQDAGVNSLLFSPDGRWLVTTRGNMPSIWEFKSGAPPKSPVRLSGHERRVFSLAISSNSRWLVTGSADKTARLWDLRSDNPATSCTVLRDQNGVSTIAISRDNRWLATGGGDKTARLWDLTAADIPNSTVLLRDEETVRSVAFSPDGRWLVSGYARENRPNQTIKSRRKTVRLWNLTSSDIAASSVTLGEHTAGVNSFAITLDSRWLITGSEDKTSRVWDLDSVTRDRSSVVLQAHEAGVQSVAVSPDSRWLVTGSLDKTVRLWDLKSKGHTRSSAVLGGHESGVTSVAMSADNRWLVTVSGKNAHLWDFSAKNGPSAKAVVLRGHESTVTSAAISPNGRWLVTASSDDQTARIWDLKSNDPSDASVVLRAKGFYVSSLAISPDSRRLVTTHANTSRVWDLNSDDPSASSVVLAHEGKVASATISRDSRWLVTGGADKTARVWNLTSRDPSATSLILKGHRNTVTSLAMGPDNRWLVTASHDNATLSDKTARLWDLKSKDPAASAIVLGEHESDVTSVAFSPNGHWLATGTYNATRLWNPNSKDPSTTSQVLKGIGSVISLSISPDNRWLVAASTVSPIISPETGRLWDLTSQDPSASAIVLTGVNTNIAEISPNGHWLVTASKNTAHLWDLTSKEPSASRVVLRGHTSSVVSIAFSFDSRWLLTGSSDKTARLWDLNIGSLLDQARRQAGRKLTSSERRQYALQ